VTVQARPQTQKNPALAAILSFLIPGLGQIYNGEVGKGIIIFVVQIINMLLATVVVGIFLGLGVWLWSIYNAHRVAEKINRSAPPPMNFAMKRCPQCAAQVPIDAKVCQYCGYQFAPMAATPAVLPGPSVARATPPPPPPSSPPPSPPEVQQGAPQPQGEQKYCPDCGVPRSPGAQFCTNCGHRFI
jgi:TM2 domain-containing membrane protein YozV